MSQIRESDVNGLVSDLAAREVASNKAIDFTTVNNTLYPTTQAIVTYVAAQIAANRVKIGSFQSII